MSSRTIKVACGQIRAALLNEADQSLAGVLEVIGEASRRDVDLLVLPECAYPAYILGSRESYHQADILRGDEYLALLREAARDHSMHIASGFVHEVDDGLYNGAALITPTGDVAGIYHKTLLWNVDARWFERGREVRAFDTELGRIGMLICADARIPELTATLVSDGAQLILLPTCWINTAPRAGEYYNPQSDFLIRARSAEFGVPFVCANKCGMETGETGYNGQSMITAADGRVLAQAPGGTPGVVGAELELLSARPIHVAARWWKTISAPACSVPSRLEAPTPIRVVLLSERELSNLTDLAGGPPDRDAAQRLLQPCRDSGVSLVMTRARHEGVAERWAQWGAAYGVPVVSYPDRLEVETFEGIRIAKMSGQAARTFAVARALSIQGAGLISIFDDSVDSVLLRTRALENRVFVGAAGASAVSLIGVNGEELAPVPGGPFKHCFEIQPGLADDKRVAPHTDVFAQRQPALYRMDADTSNRDSVPS